MAQILEKTISETFLKRLEKSGSQIAFQFKPTYAEIGAIGQWKDVSFREFYKECRWVSFGLMGLGILPGDKVAILSNTRYEWSLCDMAILGAGGISVPIYASLTGQDISYIVDQSESKVLILEDAK